VAKLTDAQASLLDNPFVGVLTTVRSDGSPHSTPVWVDYTDGVVRFNTARGRAKERHVAADPRVSITVVDPGDAYRWVSVSGRAELVDEGADAHIDALAKKYLGADEYPFRKEGERRVTVRVTPRLVDSFGLE
jgi:PPOX class probable F420-dependent enzyme